MPVGLWVTRGFRGAPLTAARAGPPYHSGMAKIGYAAMLEQFHPTELLDWCAQAEGAGFEAGFMVSEHFHPWTPQQGQAAYAWSFMGALGQRTSLRFGTAVTFPGFRMHPAVVAHAAATLGAMYPGRFWLGLGAGEALNEHILGLEWPEINVRSEMMFESIEIIAKLFEGGVVKHRGKHFKLESAKLYTRPEEPVPIYVATSGPINAKKTGKFAQGMITVGAADEKIKLLWMACDDGCREVGKPTVPKLLQIHVSWARTDEEARDSALREWPNGGMPFPKQDIKNPEDFAAMAKLVRMEDFKNRVLISSDLEAHRDHIQRYVDMGFDEIHLHNVGRNQAEFIEVFGREVLPNLKLRVDDDATPMNPDSTPEALPAG
jgi:coenzyme F420-dependent glucose-6-phosphate dehydrogenase